MITGLQAIAAFFALVLSYFSFLSMKRRDFTIREYLGWQVVWLSFGFVTLFPGQFSLVAGDFGALRALDLFTVLGFMVVLSISFYTYINLDRVRKQLEKLVRDSALRDMDDK